MLAFWSWRVVNIWVRCRCVAFLNRRPSRIFLSCEKHITLELSRVSITNADNKKNSFIVSVANRCRFVVILKFYACTVYSWLISMLKWAFYRQDVWKTPYFITHTVIKIYHKFSWPKLWEMLVRELGLLIFRSWEWKGNYLLEKKKYCYWPSVKMLIIKTKS